MTWSGDYIIILDITMTVILVSFQLLLNTMKSFNGFFWQIKKGLDNINQTNLLQDF